MCGKYGQESNSAKFKAIFVEALKISCWLNIQLRILWCDATIEQVLVWFYNPHDIQHNAAQTTHSNFEIQLEIEFRSSVPGPTSHISARKAFIAHLLLRKSHNPLSLLFRN